MRIFGKPSYDRAFRKLTPSNQAAVNAAIARLPGAVGRPHLHSSVGIRPFGPFLECRAGLQLRILFHLFEGDIILETVGTHNEIARFIKRR